MKGSQSIASNGIVRTFVLLSIWSLVGFYLLSPPWSLQEEQMLPVVGSILDQTTTGNKPVLFVHVGPWKMATSYLQSMLGNEQNYRILAEHHLMYIGSFKRKLPHLLEHLHSDSSSFIEGGMVANSHNVTMTTKFLNLLQQAKHEKKNALIVFESMSAWKTVHVRAFADAADGWHVHLIVGYRRFFEFAPSFYSQLMKPKKVNPWAQLWPGEQKGDAVVGRPIKALDMSQAGLLETFGSITENMTTHPSKVVLDSFQKVIPSSAYSVLDMNNLKNDLMDTFLCECIASKPLCDAWRNGKWENAYNENPTYSLHYDQIAIVAKESGLVRRKKLQRQYVVGRIATWQSKFPSELPFVCPSEEVTQKMLDISLSLETPPFWHEDRQFQVKAHKEAFAVKYQKLYCVVNATAALEYDNWKRFFARLQ